MDNLARPDGQGFANPLLELVDSDGSMPVVEPLEAALAEYREPSALRAPGQLARAALLADIAHFMCVSHGRHPGVIDHAATKIIRDDAREWLVKAIDAFAAERAFLTKLTVSAGPMNGHSGQDKISALLASQAKNFEMLATSDRAGCAAGAAIAFTLDWHATRPMLDGTALLLGITPPACNLPGCEETLMLAQSMNESPRIERAIMFGASQLLAQQRSLWKIIAARHLEFRAME